MRLLKIPIYVVSWYADRLGRIRRREVPTWAMAEVVCMSLSLLALVLMGALAVARLAGAPSPSWLVQYVLPLLLAGAVGYLTNLIAITMLFRPYDADDDHPAGIVPFWRQGLIPKHRDELAEKAGRQIADELLTPETIADEVGKLMERALADEDLQDKLRYAIGPILREKLPVVIDDLTPEIMRFLRGVVRDGFSRDNLDLLFEKVVDPWLKTERNKNQLANWVVQTLQHLVPRVIRWLQETADKYKKRGFWTNAMISFAEWTGALDWGVIRQEIRQKIVDRSTRAQIVASVQDLVTEMRAAVGTSDTGPAIRKLQERTSDFVVTVVENHLRGMLPDLGHRIADDRKFWRWLAEQGTPSVQPYAMAWLEGEGVDVIKEHFDVAGRAESAIKGMELPKVHEMINDASARHLGAIQVLGYILGLIAGGLLLLV